VRKHDSAYFAKWLVEPRALQPLSVVDSRLFAADGVEVPMVEGIPLFGGRELSVPQQAEPAHDRVFVNDLGDADHADRSMYDWVSARTIHVS
jgi:hypothetical protein